MEILDIKDFDTKNCPIYRTTCEVGDFWTMLIIREAFMGTKRFDEFHQTLGISKSVLTKKIKLLLENEILRKEAYQEPNQRKRYEYFLTEKGRDFFPIIIAMLEWGNKYLVDKDGDRMQLIDQIDETPVSFGLLKQNGDPLPTERLKLLLFR